MQTLSESDNTSLMTKILDNKYFLLIYKKNEIKSGEKNFFELR